MRGKHATKPIEEVMREARELAADGVRELIIVAQDTTYYGMDLYGEPRLAELLPRLEEVEGIEWIRLMYFYPMYIDDELIDMIAASQKDRALPRHAAAAHQRHDAAADGAARDAAAKPRRCWRKLRERIPGLVAADDVHHRLPGRDRRAVRGAGRFRPHSNVSSGWACSPTRCEPDTPAAQLPDHCPKRSRTSAASG